MNTGFRFDAPALNIAQKIMECQATAAVDGWPDVRLKAAIQCLVIEAMKWAAPVVVKSQVFIDGNLDGEAMDKLLREINKASPEVISINPVTAAPEGWKLVPIEPTPEMCETRHVGVDPYTGMATDGEYYSIGGQDAAKVYRAMLAAAPAPGGEHG